MGFPLFPRTARPAAAMALVTVTVLVAALPGIGPAWAFELVPVESGVEVTLSSKVPVTRDARAPSGFRAEPVTAILFDPAPQTRKAAAVIINSSGGVKAHAELFWARLLAAHGMATLVVDSFTPRGIARTTDDQSRARQSQSDADAVAGWRHLATLPGVDAARILVMGMSKGGNTALHDAIPAHMKWLGATDVTFAAHVALTPGGCALPYRDARTTNRPIFFMLADRDDLTPSTPCLELAERMRQAGNAQVERAVYPNAFHAMEWTGGLVFEAAEQNLSGCHGFIEANGTVTLGDPPRNMPASQYLSWAVANCATRGAHTGSDDTTKTHVAEDLLAFLRRHGFIRDAEIQLLLGDCTRLESAEPRLSCQRASAGSLGDAVQLGRLFARGNKVPRDEAYAARLFAFAAARDNAFGSFELAEFLLKGLGGQPRDPAKAVQLLLRAAAQEHAGAITELGVCFSEGRGIARDDAMALRLFRRAVLLRNSWAYANLGRFHLEGRAGLAKDPAEALRLFRIGTLLGNPAGQFALARALERGDGTRPDRAAALDAYRLSAAQDWSGRADAEAAVRRLEAR